MSYQNQGGAGGNAGFPSSVQGVGSQVAGHQGGINYENKPGSSLSGGGAPERNTTQGLSTGPGIQEPGYENVSAPRYTGGQSAGFNQPTGGSSYNTSSLGSQGGTNPGQQYGTTPGGSDLLTGTGATGGSHQTGTASIAGGGVNSSTVGGGSAANPSNSTGVVQQAKEVAAPYVQKAQETVQPYVAKAQPYVAQAQETISPYVTKAQEVGSAAIENARPTAERAYNAVATELDNRGINRDSTQQKLEEVGQTLKDYGAIGQQRAGEYFNQAVDQARNIGQDRENKNIIATAFGTVFLVWLAFGFSIGALFALGVAGAIATILSRYSRGHGSTTGAGSYGRQTGIGASSGTGTGIGASSGTGTGIGAGSGIGSGAGSGSNPKTGTAPNLTTPGVETHYPRPAHPDNSLNANPLK